MATLANKANHDFIMGYVTRFDVGANDESASSPVSFTVLGMDGNKIDGAMRPDTLSVAAESYAVIFTMAMANAYEVVLTKKPGDAFYSSIQLLSRYKAPKRLQGRAPI